MQCRTTCSKNQQRIKGPFSFVLFESSFTSVSTVSRGHPSLVSLGITQPDNLDQEKRTDSSIVCFFGSGRRISPPLFVARLLFIFFVWLKTESSLTIYNCNSVTCVRPYWQSTVYIYCWKWKKFLVPRCLFWRLSKFWTPCFSLVHYTFKISLLPKNFVKFHKCGHCTYLYYYFLYSTFL